MLHSAVPCDTTAPRVQVYSQRFTDLGRCIGHLAAWLDACPGAKSLDAERALAAIPAAGAALLAADHAVVYRYVGDEYWAIGPHGHWVVPAADGGAPAPRQPADVGRGMAGYVAQTQKNTLVRDAAASAIYDNDIDDVKVVRGARRAHPTMLVHEGGAGGEGVVLKVMRGWATPPAAFLPDDVWLQTRMAEAAMQVRSACCC